MNSSLQARDLKQICQIANFPCADVRSGRTTGNVVALDYTRHDLHGVKSAEPSMRHRRFLVASITKPVVAVATLQLAAEGRLSLNQPVCEFLPTAGHGLLRRVTLRHLLTHTSGLPDMLPNNTELRAAHASLDEFVQYATKCTPEFPSGTNCRYSSVAFALLGAVLQQTCACSLARLLQTMLFEPLGLHNTWLGIPDALADELLPTVFPCTLPDWQPEAADWNWNSRYWRTLGAPWGGLISTADDLATLARMLLSNGRSDDGAQIVSAAATEAVLSVQTDHIPELPETLRRFRGWTYGFRLNWPDHTASFGDFVRPQAVGHWGATGTLMWLCPVRREYAVILTTVPYESSRVPIQQLSNAITTVLR